MFCLGNGCRAADANEKSSMETEKQLIVVAHRGGAVLGPENSLGCIERGMAVGARWIEIDVHLSADGEIVVCHDPSVDRTTDGEGYISETDYASLRRLRLLDADGNPTGEHLPTLDEVLDLIKGRANLLLEIKQSRHSLPGIEQACVDCIRRHGATESVTIQSFDDEVLETVHRIAPEIRLEKLLRPPGWDSSSTADSRASTSGSTTTWPPSTSTTMPPAGRSWRRPTPTARRSRCGLSTNTTPSS